MYKGHPPGPYDARHESLLRLDTNECIIDPPEIVLDAIRMAAGRVRHYPDPAGIRLREVVADREGLRADQVVVGTGSSEVIADAWRLAATRPGPQPAAAVFTAPAFALYELACLRTGMVASTAATGPGYRQDLAQLGALANDPATRLLAISTPHNPTGRNLRHDELSQLLDAVPEQVLVLVDEAYRDFVDTVDRPDVAVLLNRHPNLLVTRTFSKAYGLAGLRVGYGLGSRALIARLRRQQLLFNVSEVAEAAVLAWLSAPDELTGRIRATKARREQLAAGLVRRGFTVVPSEANFVYATDGGASWARALLDCGIAVHSTGDGIRISVGRSEQQMRLFAAIDRLRERPAGNWAPEAGGE